MNTNNTGKITIKKKNTEKGYDGHKTISVRLTDSLFIELENLADRTHRSRNELINYLLEQAVSRVEIED